MVSSLCFGFDCFHDKGQGSGEEGPSHQTTLQTGIHSRYRNWFKKRGLELHRSDTFFPWAGG